MSRLEIKQPKVYHTPSFEELVAPRGELTNALANLGVDNPIGLLDSWYYHTNDNGWAALLPDLLLKSSLYQTDRRDCDWYALKAMTICHERYGLNAFGVAIGQTPLGYHAWNILYLGAGEFLFFEPNAGFEFSGSAFPIGQNEYQAKVVLL